MMKFITRAVVITAFVCLLAAFLLGAAGMKEDSRSADVIVVFGNKVGRNGEPSLSLASRLDKALLLYRDGRAPYVIVSGGLGKEGWNEAEVMANYLAERGIPRQFLLVDSQGLNTYLTAQNAARLSMEYGFHSFLLVSHFYHLPRARLTFLRLGLEPVGIAHAERFVARDFYYGLIREVIAYPVYFFRLLAIKPTSPTIPAER